jgi:hypothetical protein
MAVNIGKNAGELITEFDELIVFHFFILIFFYLCTGKLTKKNGSEHLQYDKFSIFESIA